MTSHHILATVDLLHPDTRPLAAASQLARQHRAAMTTLAVLEPVSALFGGLDTIREADFEAEMLSNAREELKTLCRKVKAPVDSAVVELGNKSATIASMARRLKADLIVVGAHGFHGFEYFLGTTATGVLHAAHCNVLGVRSDRSGKYQCLLAALDAESSSIDVLREARALAPGAQLHAIHVMKPLLAGYSSSIADLNQELPVDSIEGRLRGELGERMEQLINQADVGDVTVHIRQGTPSKEIKRLLQELGADLAAMGSGQPAGSGWLIGSTTQNVLHGCDCDALIVRTG
jgi:universal stress protein A